MKTKLKIGIFSNDHSKLNDGQIKIINEILDSKFADLNYILQDEQSIKFNFITNSFYKFISLIENKYCRITRINKDKKIKRINLTKNDFDNLLINKDLLSIIKKLDLLIFFEKSFFMNSKITTLPKYGTWFIDYGVNNNIFVGFWESFLKLGTSKVIIQKINKSKVPSKINIIDKGIYSTRTISWFLNRDFIFEKSSTLIFKNLKLLNTKYFTNSKILSDYKVYKNPNLFILFLYTLKKYPIALLRKILNSFSSIFQNNKRRPEPKYNPWNLYIGNKDKKDLHSFKLSLRIKPNDNQAWADPFIISENKNDYIFFENWEYNKSKGKISYTKIKDNKISKISDALNLNYHLSYPFLWKQNRHFYMIPESCEKKCIQIWRTKDFPKNWVLYKTIFKGESCVDTTIFDDKKGDRWLFTNKSNDKYNDHNSELYIYKTDKKFNRLIPHRLNPVIIDSRFARNAGNIYYNNKGLIMRPSQINTHNLYGGGLNIRIIKKLNLKEFEEINCNTYYPNFKNNISAIHHITQNDSKYVIDARYKKLLFYFMPKNY